MVEERAQRRLAAILAADVVGYSRLMAADESGTLARFKLLRGKHFEPAIKTNRGRLVGEAGDSLLVEFTTATEAVACAIEVQRKIAELNAELPEDQRMRFRIGINLGEVVVDGATIHGDGVNIAARLEGIAEPGGICLSRSAYDQVKSKIDAEFTDMGKQNLKNIAEPVRIYRVDPGHAATAAAALPALALPDKPSVAVLPFENLSGDPEQEYFSDGITEDIITELARFHSLFVIARNSSFQYRGKAVDVRRVGRELGVRYVVEGSIRRSENRVRIAAQLLEADTGAHLWADRYDRALDDAFAVQDEVTRAIVAALPRLIGEAQVEHRRRRPTQHLSAYDLVLRGEWHMYHGDVTGNQEALSLFERALAIDPAYARAHAHIAYQHAYAVFQFSSGSAERLRRARHHCERALALDDGDATVHELAAFVYLVAGEHRLAESHAIKAVMLNPNDRYAVGARGLVAIYRGNARLGIEWHLKARRLDPRNFDAGREPLIEAYYCAREYAAALDEFQQWRRPPPHVLLEVAACYAQLGLSDEVRATLARFEATRPPDFDFSEYTATQYRMYERQADRDHWHDGYRKAGLPE